MLIIVFIDRANLSLKHKSVP